MTSPADAEHETNVLSVSCPTCPSQVDEGCRYWVPQEGGWGTYRVKPHVRRTKLAQTGIVVPDESDDE